MSRNNNLRKIANELPKFPLLLNGKVQYDGRGKAIQVNHFKHLLKLKRYAVSKEIADKMQEKYVLEVMSYEENRLKRLRKRNNRLIAFAVVVITIAGLIIATR